MIRQEKALERVSVDYTRFEHIEDENEEPSNIQHDEDPAIALEFADDLSEQERRQLENLLTGKEYDGKHKRSWLALKLSVSPK